jgi:hypothetical protein
LVKSILHDLAPNHENGKKYLRSELFAGTLRRNNFRQGESILTSPKAHGV